MAASKSIVGDHFISTRSPPAGFSRRCRYPSASDALAVLASGSYPSITSGWLASYIAAIELKVQGPDRRRMRAVSHVLARQYPVTSVHRNRCTSVFRHWTRIWGVNDNWVTFFYVRCRKKQSWVFVERRINWKLAFHEPAVSEWPNSWRASNPEQQMTKLVSNNVASCTCIYVCTEQGTGSSSPFVYGEYTVT